MDRCARALASEILAKTVETAHNKASCDRLHLELGVAAGVIKVECGSIVCSVKGNSKGRRRYRHCSDSVHQHLEPSPMRNSAPDASLFGVFPTSLSERETDRLDEKNIPLHSMSLRTLIIGVDA